MRFYWNRREKGGRRRTVAIPVQVIGVMPSGYVAIARDDRVQPMTDPPSKKVELVPLASLEEKP